MENSRAEKIKITQVLMVSLAKTQLTSPGKILPLKLLK